jgi:hypothetical protein
MADSAPVENLVIREADDPDLFVLMGSRAGLLFQAPARCLSPSEGLARVWDEWLPLGRWARVAKLPNVKRVTATGRAWLLARLRDAAA